LKNWIRLLGGLRTPSQKIVGPISYPVANMWVQKITIGAFCKFSSVLPFKQIKIKVETFGFCFQCFYIGKKTNILREPLVENIQLVNQYSYQCSCQVYLF